MAMPSLTALLKGNRPSFRVPTTLNTDGGLRYAMCDYDDWRGNGFNAAKATKGVGTITFSPADATPGQEATVVINEGASKSVAIRLKNGGAANVAWASLLLSAINGTGSPSNLQVSAGELRGYVATAAGAVVTITGLAGRKFTITANGFTTAPVIAQTTAAICPGVIPYGRAVVVDQAVATNTIFTTSSNRRIQSSVASEPSSVLFLPSASTTAVFVGITVKDQVGAYDMFSDCCGNVDTGKEGYDCGDCAHYLIAQPGNSQMVKVTLEQPTAGDADPVNWVGSPLSYRETGVAANPDAGTISIGAADANRKLARNVATGTQLVVRHVIDKATRQVWVGIAV